MRSGKSLACPWGVNLSCRVTAKRAAGDKNVLAHGVGTARLALASGMLANFGRTIQGRRRAGHRPRPGGAGWRSR